MFIIGACISPRENCVPGLRRWHPEGQRAARGGAAQGRGGLDPEDPCLGGWVACAPLFLSRGFLPYIDKEVGGIRLLVSRNVFKMPSARGRHKFSAHVGGT